MLSRHVLPSLQEALGRYPVVSLTGPHQVGKTSLVQDLVDRQRYCSLDHPDTVQEFREDPGGSLRRLAAGSEDPVVIEEIQKSPGLARYILRLADRDPRPGRFLLTGTVDVVASQARSVSRAPRLWTTSLWPLTVAEARGLPAGRILDWAIQERPDAGQISTPEVLAQQEYIELFLRGGFPGIRSLDADARQSRYRALLEHMVEKSAREIITLRKPQALHALLGLLAQRTASESSIESLIRKLDADRETVGRYLDVLTRMSLVLPLAGWTQGTRPREIRRPKYHFLDSAMVCAQCGRDASSLAQDAAALNSVAETFVFQELLRSLPMQDGIFTLHHWRNRNGSRIDLVAGTGAAVVGMQVRMSPTVGPRDFAYLDGFADRATASGKWFTGIVWYPGDRVIDMGERRFVLPVSALWSCIDGLEPRHGTGFSCV